MAELQLGHCFQLEMYFLNPLDFIVFSKCIFNVYLFVFYITAAQSVWRYGLKKQSCNGCHEERQ